MADCPALVEHLKDKEISDFTLAIPFPYQLSGAEWFVNFTQQRKEKLKHNRDWAIRKADGELIGVISFVGDVSRKNIYSAEIGYWLAKKYWGVGIMSNSVNALCSLAFKEHKYVRLEAPVFAHNIGSQRVLEKCGFELEGRLKRAYYKNENFFDSLLYAKVI